MRAAGDALVEPLRVSLARALADVDLDQSVADEQRRRDAGLDRLLVPAADDEAIDDGVHVLDVRGVEIGLSDKSMARPSTISRRHALLPQLGEHEIEIFAVDLEDRRAQLDLGAVRQRQDGLEDLARRAARRRLAGAGAVRLRDRRKQQVQIARDVGHRPHGRARIVRERLLLDRDDRRQAEDEVDVRLGDLGDEALGEAGERLHVAALSLGVDRVERQARLARP